MSVQTKIAGYSHLRGDRVPSAGTIAQASQVASIFQDSFSLQALDTAPLNDVNIRVWGSYPDGSCVEVAVFWDGLADIAATDSDGSFGITGLTFDEAITHLQKMKP